MKEFHLTKAFMEMKENELLEVFLGQNIARNSYNPEFKLLTSAPTSLKCFVALQSVRD